MHWLHAKLAINNCTERDRQVRTCDQERVQQWEIVHSHFDLAVAHLRRWQKNITEQGFDWRSTLLNDVLAAIRNFLGKFLIAGSDSRACTGHVHLIPTRSMDVVAGAIGFSRASEFMIGVRYISYSFLIRVEALRIGMSLLHTTKFVSLLFYYACLIRSAAP